MTPVEGVVAAGHDLTADAAVEVLGRGGNAFDAVVAAGFAAAVVEPTLTSLGGGGFLLAHTADGALAFDFFVDTPGRGRTVLEPHFLPVTVRFPSSTQDFNVGWGSVAVPGVLDGYMHVHRRLGRLALADVVAPAVRSASRGVALNAWQSSLFELLEPILTLSEEAAAIFSPGGRLLGEGDLLVNEHLAGFLEEVGTGRVTGIGDPSLVPALVAASDAGDGLITAADLESYEVAEREPLETTYRGHRILTNPPPAFGGELVALALQLLDQRPASAPWGSAEDLQRHLHVMREVDVARTEETVPARLRATRGTTHVSVADHDGNVATMTTSNGEGSGFLLPGAGVMLNNMLGEDDLHPDGFHAAPPGLRVSSMMSPTLVYGDAGVPVLALGSGGSKRIRTALCQVIAAVVDHGFEVDDAVEASRIHWDGELLQVEPGFDEDCLAKVARNVPLNRWDERNLYFGGVHAVVPGAGGGGDPRRGGVVRRLMPGSVA